MGIYPRCLPCTIPPSRPGVMRNPEANKFDKFISNFMWLMDDLGPDKSKNMFSSSNYL